MAGPERAKRSVSRAGQEKGACVLFHHKLSAPNRLPDLCDAVEAIEARACTIALLVRCGKAPGREARGLARQSRDMSAMQKQCGACSLCCKTMVIAELKKPKDSWCPN